MTLGDNNTDVEAGTLNGTPATVTWGDTGDVIRLTSQAYEYIDESTTSTSYVTVYPPTSRINFRVDNLSMTNIGTYYIAWGIDQLRDDANVTGDNVYATLQSRADLANQSQLEMTSDGDTYRPYSGLVETTPDELEWSGGVAQLEIQIMVDGSAQCGLTGIPYIEIFGEIS